MKKSPQEVERIRAACRLTDACLEYLLPLIRPGVAESALQLEVELFLRRHGATAAFSPIVVSGERSARPHGTPSEKPLEVGDFVTFDIGARLDGYCSDITRTFVIGEASERHIEVYEQVLKGQLAALDALQPGANGKEVDLLVRAILDEKSFAAYFGHSLGHGLGALVHDAGRLSQTTEQPIEVGQVWTVEPGVYIEGFGGVRIEDDVLITERGAEVLTHFPKRLMILGA
jgi:Xaa-Pro aminopeptidase